MRLSHRLQYVPPSRSDTPAQSWPLLACLTLLLIMGASFAWQLQQHLQTLQSPAKQAISPRQHNAAGDPDITFLARLFGNAPNPASTSQPTRLNLRLEGSFVQADPAGSSAIIRHQDKSRRYRVGDEITPGVILQHIAPLEVRLLRQGHLETLAFRPAGHALQAVAERRSEPSSDSPPDTEQALQDLHADDLARLQERMNSLREQLQLDNSTPPNQPSTDAP